MEIESIIILVLLGGFVLWFYLVGRKATRMELAQKDSKEKEFSSAVLEIGNRYLTEGIPVVESDIKLNKGEQLFAILNKVEWMEPRKVVTGYSTSGLGGSVRISKGLRFKYGENKVTRHTVDQFQVIDSGPLYITNKRFFLRGQFSNKTIDLEKVLNIEAGSIGFIVERDSAKKVLISHSFIHSPKNLAAVAVSWQLVSEGGNS